MSKLWAVKALSRAYCSSPSPSPSTASFPLKHVTKSNFESALTELRHHVRAADFVAIDLEMTGVTSAPWRESFAFDRFDVRYLKVKDSAEKFAVVQFGVCPFQWDPLRHSFIAHPYNFFVFPRHDHLLPGASGPSAEFLCQTTSMDFLAKYEFDFNACIHQGVSYLSRAQEEEALRSLNLRNENGFFDSKQVRDVLLCSITDVLFSERMKNRLSEWRHGLFRVGNRNEVEPMSNESNQQFQTIFYKTRPAVLLIGFTSHQLRLIQLVTKKHFKDLAFFHVDGEDSCSQQLVVYIESEDDKEKLMTEVRDAYHRGAEMKIKAAIGFRHVIDLLSSDSKLIVGHNCFLDFAHIYSKFLCPLPSTAEEYVYSIHKNFPYIVDTKILLNANNVLHQKMRKSRTSLSSAFSLLCPHFGLASKNSHLGFRPCIQVEVEVDNIRSSSWISGVKHEAGYDAFMTGCVFAQTCSHLGIDFEIQSASKNLVHNEKLRKHINLLYFSWIIGDIIDLSTGKRIPESLESNKPKKWQPNVLFENIVLIWRFPVELKAGEIRECISKVFGPGSVTSVYHVDETAVFVQFSKDEFVSEFLVLKEYLDRSNDVISVLHPLSRLLEGGNTCAASYETYKDICSSPISKVLFADQAEAVGITWKTKLVESNVELHTQEQESFDKAKAKNIDSVSGETSKTCKKHEERDQSSGGSSCDEVIDPFYAAELKQIRATNVWF